MKKNMCSYSVFDIKNAPLEGANLIEAGAGTGKTYTLTGLFIRLLIEKPISIDRILVVTFTEAATSELKQRIRTRLRNALYAFSGRETNDVFLNGLAADYEYPATAVNLLQQAIRDFDQASIFTIHGFCRRVLLDHAFESGMPFETDLVTDNATLLSEIVEDFWRRHLPTASPLFARYAMENGFKPQDLLSLAQTVKGPIQPHIIPRPDTPETASLEQAFVEAFERVRKTWTVASADVEEILLKHKGLNRNKYRKSSIWKWIHLMNAFLARPAEDPRAFQDFEKFTAPRIRSSTRPGETPPEHPFFDRCEELGRCMEDLSEAFHRKLLGLKRALLGALHRELRLRKAKRNEQSFDDLLLNVSCALEGRFSGRLARALRTRFEAALIDEFQDTDPVQYGIFKEIFFKNETPVFFIGDPKQAIYGFRGADVFAYVGASKEATSRYTLLKNFRSEPRLVRAVNAVFQAHPRPFVLKDISYPPVGPGLDQEKARTLLLEGRSKPPLEIWFMESKGQDVTKGKITKGAATAIIADKLCAEVSRLIELGRSGRADLGGKPVREEDIAVILRTNQEAQIIQRAFSKSNIPTVLYTMTSLFEVPETVEMLRVLEALTQPEQEARVRAALGTDIFGMQARDIHALSEDDGSWEKRLVSFQEYQEIWKEKGFMQMFRRLLRREGTLRRLLAFPDGERRATNLFHLTEILHKAEMDRRLGMQGLGKWLREQENPLTRGSEEHPLRLESDGNAVKLVTIHKSKGLEYPIVFCPFMWAGTRTIGKNDAVSFHHPRDKKLTMDLGSPPGDRERHISLAENEALSENLRLLYVALTRAAHRCYLVWGKFNRADTSAPAYLFHTRESDPELDPVRSTVQRFEALDDDSMLNDLESIREGVGDCIRVAPLKRAGFGEPASSAPKTTPCLYRRTFRGDIDRTFKISSFSSLTSSRPHSESLPDHGPIDEDIPDIEGFSRDETPDGFFGFPKGAHAGTCLHEILENADFTDQTEKCLAPLVRKKLSEYGFAVEWEKDVVHMLQNVFSARLDPSDPGLRLSRVPKEKRLNELAFFFPLNRITPKSLADILRPHSGVHVPKEIPERIGRLRFSPSRGFMRGFIDLVFEHAGKFYLVDWKSNFLGPDTAYYQDRGLEAAMAKELYCLQYLIYTLALDGYLSLRLPGYSYATHFGGVFYVFLRGFSSQGSSAAGVYHDVPHISLMGDLKAALIPARSATGDE